MRSCVTRAPTFSSPPFSMPAAGERSFTSAMRSKPPALAMSCGGSGVSQSPARAGRRASVSACATRERSRLLAAMPSRKSSLMRSCRGVAQCAATARERSSKQRVVEQSCGGAAVDGLRRRAPRLRAASSRCRRLRARARRRAAGSPDARRCRRHSARREARGVVLRIAAGQRGGGAGANAVIRRAALALFHACRDARRTARRCRSAWAHPTPRRRESRTCARSRGPPAYAPSASRHRGCTRQSHATAAARDSRAAPEC